MSQQELYLVEAIKGKRKKNGKTEYYVKWYNYEDKDNTWEPEANLQSASHLIKEYESKPEPEIEKVTTIQTNSTIQKNTPDLLSKKKKTTGKRQGESIKNEEKIKEEVIQKVKNEKVANHTFESTQGSFGIDVACSIVKASLVSAEDKDFLSLVEWKPRANGFVPEPTWIDLDQAKREVPLLLIEFLRKNIKFPKDKK